MSKEYFDIIEKLESLGKYKQADLVEQYIKSAQSRSNVPTPLPSFLDPMGYAKATQSFTPQFESGANRNLNLQNITQRQLTPQEMQLYKYNPEFIRQFQQSAMEVAGGFAQGRGINNLINFLKMIDQSLVTGMQRGLTPSAMNEEFKNRFYGPLRDQIIYLINSEQNINTMRNSLFTALNSTVLLKSLDSMINKQTGAIAQAFTDALQNLKPQPYSKPNLKNVAKYNQIVTDPTFRQYINTSVFQPMNII